MVVVVMEDPLNLVTQATRLNQKNERGVLTLYN